MPPKKVEKKVAIEKITGSITVLVKNSIYHSPFIFLPALIAQSGNLEQVRLNFTFKIFFYLFCDFVEIAAVNFQSFAAACAYKVMMMLVWHRAERIAKLSLFGNRLSEYADVFQFFENSVNGRQADLRQFSF